MRMQSSVKTARTMVPLPILPAAEAVANAYDYAGDDYGHYADGEEQEDIATGPARSAHADAILWGAICATIDQLRTEGVATLRVLDAGCGPGAWIRRIAAHAHQHELNVEAVGFDISTGQLDIARRRTDRFLARIGGACSLKVEFLEHSLAKALPWANGQFHLVLCNFAVLNHLPQAVLHTAIAELCRVASARVIATVRALASPATACIVSPDRVREYHLDCTRGQLALLLKDGTEHQIPFNPYSAEALKELFVAHATIIDIRAMDLFLSRFAPDAHWTAVLIKSLPGRQETTSFLRDLEESLCRLPAWVNQGTHVLIVAEPTSANSSAFPGFELEAQGNCDAFAR
jgi:SAM-dependent methyltransferase